MQPRRNRRTPGPPTPLRPAPTKDANPQASECEYVDYSPGPDIEAAVVRPVVPALQVRKAGPDSPVIGTLNKKQWVTVKGRCRNNFWLKIAYGYSDGWVFNWFTCQPRPGFNVITSPREEVEEYFHPEPDVWQVFAPHCPSYSETGVLLEGDTDEEIAALGRKILRNPEAAMAQIMEPEPEERTPAEPHSGPEAIAVPLGGNVKCEDVGTVENHFRRCRRVDSPTGE